MYRRSRSRKVKSEINITPLIDVMMSLLAIFMITAPLLTTGIPLNLPKGDGKQIQGEEKTLDINVDKDGQVYLGKDAVKKDDILSKIQAILRENPKIRMMISADRTAEYGTVIELMAMLRAAGYTEVGLRTDSAVVEVPKGKKK